MRLLSRLPVQAATALLVAACGEGPITPEIDDPSLAISDAVHQGGNEHFFWLPPMVGNPGSFNGTFDGALSPIVRICEFLDDQTPCVLVEDFTTATSPGSDRVRAVPEEEHYIVNWHTNEFEVEPGPTYRVSVLVNETELGYADVELGSTGKEVKNLATDDLIALKDGRTLPIKFRVEQGAVPTAGAIQVVKSADAPGIFVFAGGLGEFTLEVPESADIAAQTFPGLAPSETFVITETLNAGFDFVSVACTLEGGGATGEVDGTGVTGVEVQLGKTTTCTFTNSVKTTGAIEVIKSADAPGIFTFTGDLGDFTLEVTESLESAAQTFDGLDPAETFAITETLDDNVEFGSVTCMLEGEPTGPVDGTGVTDVEVEAGKTTTCTFTSSVKTTGTIVVIKSADAPGIFAFAGDLGDFTLEVTESPGTAGRTFPDLDAAVTFDIAEAPHVNFDFESVTCMLENEEVTGTEAGTGVTGVVVEAGKTTTCTFTNTLITGSAAEWINPAGGDWSIGANWDTGQVPGELEEARITLDGTYTVVVDINPTVAGLTIGGLNGAQTVTASIKTLNVTGTVNVVGTGTLSLGSSTLNAANVVNTSTNSLVLTASTINAPVDNRGMLLTRSTTALNEGLTTGAGSVLRIEGFSNLAATLTVAGGLTNTETIELASLSGSVATLTVTGGTLVNAVGGTITATDAPAKTINAVLDNQGTITSVNSLILNGTTLTNSGTVTVTTGPLTINPGAGGLTNTNTGTLDTSAGGDLTVTNTVSSTFTTSGTVTVGAGGTLTVNNGSLAYTGGSFVVGEELALNSLTATFTPSMTLGIDGPSTLLLARMTLNAPALTLPAASTPRFFQATINAPVVNETTLLTQSTTALNEGLTIEAGSVLRIEGFSNLSATLTGAGGLTNTETIELASLSGSAATLTVTGGTLVNALGATITVTGSSVKTINAVLDNRGTITSSANSLTLNGTTLTNSGTVTVNGPVNLSGQLIVPNIPTGTFDGNGSTLTVAGVDIDGATFDNVPLISTGGTIERFNNVTFQNMSDAATQLTINHPGALLPFTFDNVDFLTTPDTGLYISATDTGGVDVLTIRLPNSTPADGSGATTATSGGAVVDWLP